MTRNACKSEPLPAHSHTLFSAQLDECSMTLCHRACCSFCLVGCDLPLANVIFQIVAHLSPGSLGSRCCPSIPIISLSSDCLLTCLPLQMSSSTPGSAPLVPDEGVQCRVNLPSLQRAGICARFCCSCVLVYASEIGNNIRLSGPSPLGPNTGC